MVLPAHSVLSHSHLMGSLSAVVDLVLQYLPDILFLGDFVTSRSHIGKLKKLIEHDLKDEWCVITNISALPGRLVGIGAIINCSLAKHITDYNVIPLDQVNKTDWEAAVADRVLRLRVTRQGGYVHVGIDWCLSTRCQKFKQSYLHFTVRNAGQCSQSSKTG